MLLNIPLMAVALIVYNLVIAGLLGSGEAIAWDDTVTSLALISGAVWRMSLGDMMVALGLFLLFLEILKATRVGSGSIVDHLLSTLVLVVFLIEFLVVQSAATAVFFLLMLMALVDVLAGFAVSVRSATRDVSIGHGGY